MLALPHMRRTTGHGGATAVASTAPRTTRAPCTPSTRACDHWNWGVGTLRPDCCTKLLMELTEFTHELLERHGITHWLDYGALLGAVREGTLIPWDGDLDFGVLQRDEAAILALADEVEVAGHRIDYSLPGVIRFVCSPVNDLHIDLFLWRQADGELLPLDDAEFAWPGMAGRLAFPERFVTDLEHVELHGRSLPAPAPVHEFLRDHRYGPDYATPRRPILSVRLYPSFDLDEATPEVNALIDHIADGDQRLLSLRTGGPRSRWSHHRAVEIWQKAGLPLKPTARHLSAVLAGLPDGAITPTVRSLARSAALVDQAIDEYERPSAALPVKRAGRRARRILELAVARAQRRPHHAGFPFGVSSAPEPH